MINENSKNKNVSCVYQILLKFGKKKKKKNMISNSAKFQGSNIIFSKVMVHNASRSFGLRFQILLHLLQKRTKNVRKIKR